MTSESPKKGGASSVLEDPCDRRVLFDVPELVLLIDGDDGPA